VKLLKLVHREAGAILILLFPEFDHGVSPEGAGRAAVLPGHHLMFNEKSTDNKSGEASVAAHAGSDVWGGLYTVSDGDLDKLDKGGRISTGAVITTSDGQHED